MEKLSFNGKEYQSITHAIRELLSEGKSRTEVAKALNVHYSYVSNVIYYDNKKNDPETIAAKEEKKRVRAEKKAQKLADKATKATKEVKAPKADKKAKKSTKVVEQTEEEIINAAILNDEIPDAIAKDMKNVA